MKRCPGCGHEVPESAMRCEYCGIALTPDVPPDEESETAEEGAGAVDEEGAGTEAGSEAADGKAGEEPPLVMVRGKPTPAERYRPRRERLQRTRVTAPGEAMKTGLVLVREYMRILWGTRQLRTLKQQRNDAIIKLGRTAWKLRIKHRDLLELYEKLREIEDLITEKQRDMEAVGLQPVSDDKQIKRAELRLQKVKVKKLQRSINEMENEKLPIFLEIGERLNAVKVSRKGLNDSYSTLDDISEGIQQARYLIDSTRAAADAIDRRKKQLAYVYWGGTILLTIILVWAALEFFI